MKTRRVNRHWYSSRETRATATLQAQSIGEDQEEDPAQQGDDSHDERQKALPYRKESIRGHSYTHSFPTNP